MHPDASGSVASFDTVETFHNKVQFGQFFRRMIPLFVAIFLVGALLFALGLSLFGLEGLTCPLSLALSAVLCAVLYVMKKKQFESTWSAATLRLSPHGATFDDRHLQIDLPWSRIHRVGETSLMDPLRMGNQAVGAVAAASLRRAEEGLVGAGSMIVKPEASATVRAQMARADQGQPIQPDSGQPLRAITLTHYDPQWRTGRIGQWIRAHRPDLLS